MSSSEESLDESEMNSLPTATTPRPADDTEVLSQRIPEQEAMVPEMPQGKIPGTGHMGGETPMDYADGSHSKSGSQPATASEPIKVPNSSKQSLTKECEPAVPMTSTQPEASDNLFEVLRGASIDDEHRTLMSTVIEKVRFAKSGLIEACTNQLTGFEVSKKV